LAAFYAADSFPWNHARTDEEVNAAPLRLSIENQQPPISNQQSHQKNMRLAQSPQSTPRIQGEIFDYRSQPAHPQFLNMSRNPWSRFRKLPKDRKFSA
jgi:hypothetical protein